jgi:hypothetical protein
MAPIEPMAVYEAKPAWRLNMMPTKSRPAKHSILFVRFYVNEILLRSNVLNEIQALLIRVFAGSHSLYFASGAGFFVTRLNGDNAPHGPSIL